MGESARQLRVNLPVKQGWVKAVYAARTGLLTFGVVSVCGRGWAGLGSAILPLFSAQDVPGTRKTRAK